MGKVLYRKPEASNIQGLCVKCKVNKQESTGKKRGTFRPLCTSCSRERYGVGAGSRSSKRRYKSFKGSVCEVCGFTPEHPCQLDVDHIDGDHSNNKPENLQTLCANCHRLKTYKNKDWANK